jgi:ATP-dependent Lhr-like helicase
MHLAGLERVLRGIQSGEIRTFALDTPEPSVLGYEILNANPYAYLDDAPLEERRTRAVMLRRTLPVDAADGTGVLDPAAIEQVAAESWPEVRDADELHDALLTLVVLPPVPAWAGYFAELESAGRARLLMRKERPFWTATEKEHFAADAVSVLRGWMESSGPSTASALAERLAFHSEGAGTAGGGRSGPSRAFHQSVAGRGDRVVQPSRTGADSSHHSGPAAARD